MTVASSVLFEGLLLPHRSGDLHRAKIRRPILAISWPAATCRRSCSSYSLSFLRGLHCRRSISRSCAADKTNLIPGCKKRNHEEARYLLPGCDYNHWLVVMEFSNDPSPTSEQMIDTYLNTIATVLGSMEEAKKNMYAFSTTTYTGFQCTVSEVVAEKFKGLPGVLWVLPDVYIDVKHKDYGGDKYINGKIIPWATQ